MSEFAVSNIYSNAQYPEADTPRASSTLPEESASLLLQTIRDAVVVLDLKGIVTYWNAGAERLFGWQASEIVGNPLYEGFPEEMQAEYRRAVQAVIHGAEWNEEREEFCKGGSKVWINARAVRIDDRAGHPIGILGISHDITDRKKAEQRQRFLSQASDVLASSLDYETTLDSVARLVVPELASWCRIHLVNEAGVLELVTVMHPDPAKVEMARESSRRYPPRMDVPRGPGAVFLSGVPQWTENVSEAMLRAISHDDEHFRQLTSFGITSYLCVPLIARGKMLGTITFFGVDSRHRYTAESLPLAQELAARAAIAVDNARLFAEAQREIQERQRAEAEIAALNARLRRSVQETHHRVKNNLQIISALADLQMDESQENVPTTALARIGQHARALAAVHDLLTHATRIEASTEFVSTKAILDKLIPLLQATTGGRVISYQVDDLQVSVQESASVALLVSELISNAVKHGRGTIGLALTVGTTSARLEVCDDGPGFPPDFNWQTAANTGLSLIDSTGRHDLQGVISYENRAEGGGRVVVEFPLPGR